MRQLTAALAAGAVFATVLPAVAQEPPKPPKPPKASSPATGFAKTDPASFVAADRTPEAIQSGVKQFARTGEAYRKAPALVEKIVIDVNTPMGNQKTLIDSMWGADGAFDIMVDGQMRTRQVGLNLDRYCLVNNPRDPRLMSTQQTGNTCYFQARRRRPTPPEIARRPRRPRPHVSTRELD